MPALSAIRDCDGISRLIENGALMRLEQYRVTTCLEVVQLHAAHSQVEAFELGRVPYHWALPVSAVQLSASRYSEVYLSLM